MSLYRFLYSDYEATKGSRQKEWKVFLDENLQERLKQIRYAAQV